MANSLSVQFKYSSDTFFDKTDKIVSIAEKCFALWTGQGVTPDTGIRDISFDFANEKSLTLFIDLIKKEYSDLIFIRL
jgi:hypothetical protein